MDRDFADIERRYLLERARLGLPALPIITDWKKAEIEVTTSPSHPTGEREASIYYRILDDIVFVRGEFQYDWSVINVKLPYPYADVQTFIPYPVPIQNSVIYTQMGQFVLGTMIEDYDPERLYKHIFKFDFSYTMREDKKWSSLEIHK